MPSELSLRCAGRHGTVHSGWLSDLQLLHGQAVHSNLPGPDPWVAGCLHLLPAQPAGRAFEIREGMLQPLASQKVQA